MLCVLVLSKDLVNLRSCKVWFLGLHYPRQCISPEWWSALPEGGADRRQGSWAEMQQEVSPEGQGKSMTGKGDLKSNSRKMSNRVLSPR